MSAWKHQLRVLLGQAFKKQQSKTATSLHKECSTVQDGPTQYIQLVLYARPRFPDHPHFAFYVTSDPTDPYTSAIKHDATDSLRTLPDGSLDESWRYQRKPVSKIREDGLVVVRATIGTFRNDAETVSMIEQLLARVPCYQRDDPDPEKAGMNCVDWVRRALESLRAQTPPTLDFAQLESWELVRQRVLEYEREKRSIGRWKTSWRGSSSDQDIEGIPTIELRFGLPGTELVE